MNQFNYNIARMSTESFIGKSPQSRISTYSSMDKYLGYSMYVLLGLTQHISYTSTAVSILITNI